MRLTAIPHPEKQVKVLMAIQKKIGNSKGRLIERDKEPIVIGA